MKTCEMECLVGIFLSSPIALIITYTRILQTLFCSQWVHKELVYTDLEAIRVGFMVLLLFDKFIWSALQSLLFHSLFVKYIISKIINLSLII